MCVAQLAEKDLFPPKTRLFDKNAVIRKVVSLFLTKDSPFMLTEAAEKYRVAKIEGARRDEATLAAMAAEEMRLVEEMIALDQGGGPRTWDPCHVRDKWSLEDEDEDPSGSLFSN